jgi:hypothetical protein
VTELMVYVAGAVALESVALTTLGSELVALKACPEARVPNALKLVDNPSTVDCSCPSELSCDKTVESRFCSAVIGIVAIATARVSTLCKSLEYWLTLVKVIGANTDELLDVEAAGEAVLVLILVLDLLIGTIEAIVSQD